MSEHLWEVAVVDEAEVQAIQDTAQVSRPTAIVLASHNISPNAVANFLNPTLSSLEDPYELAGTKEAASRLWQAIKTGEKILIHGDYDADGITSTVLLSSILRHNGAKTTCFLPHRIDDGYGLTPDSIEKSCDGHTLLVTVDCGITSFEAVDAATQRGLDVIITDHHEPAERIPEAKVIVNPKYRCSSPEVKHLAGVGVTFKVCHAFLKYGRENGLGGMATDLRDGLDLVALGTVADIVPLLHENRSLVKHGLKVLSQQHRPGIRALCEIANVNEPVSTTDIAYRLAPRLNAAGRMGDPTEAYRLLQCQSMVEAFSLADLLDTHNRNRQTIEETAMVAAEAQIKSQIDLTKARTIVVAGEDWHQGVIGIVASRLVRKYHRPSIVLSTDGDGLWGGSGRSIRPVNLVSVLEKCSSQLTRFGGHAMAAGLSLHQESLSRFRELFEDAVAEILAPGAMKPQLEIAGDVSFAEISDQFFSELKDLEPFGHSNHEPVFRTSEVFPERKLPAGARHTRGTLRDISGARFDFIAFGRTINELPPPPWTIAYTPQINTFAGRNLPQIKIIDIDQDG
jgi:single-stranded-DNA-specific exonuclease